VENIAVQIIVGAVFVFTLGSFIEYVVHRLMHKRILLGQVHVDHHKEGTGQGFAKEFKDYFVPTLPINIGAALICWLVLGMPFMALGAVAGGLFYCAFAAYAHQVQHEFPEMVIWMRRPVHTIHHEHKMWFHNFGIATDIWDRLFGTYKYVEWKPERKFSFRRFFQIRWISNYSAGSIMADMEPLDRGNSGSAPKA